jgi:hypothetical protein
MPSQSAFALASRQGCDVWHCQPTYAAQLVYLGQLNRAACNGLYLPARIHSKLDA